MDVYGAEPALAHPDLLLDIDPRLLPAKADVMAIQARLKLPFTARSA